MMRVYRKSIGREREPRSGKTRVLHGVKRLLWSLTLRQHGQLSQSGRQSKQSSRREETDREKSEITDSQMNKYKK